MDLDSPLWALPRLGAGGAVEAECSPRQSAASSLGAGSAGNPIVRAAPTGCVLGAAPHTLQAESPRILPHVTLGGRGCDHPHSSLEIRGSERSGGLSMVTQPVQGKSG